MYNYFHFPTYSLYFPPAVQGKKKLLKKNFHQRVFFFFFFFSIKSWGREVFPFALIKIQIQQVRNCGCLRALNASWDGVREQAKQTNKPRGVTLAVLIWSRRLEMSSVNSKPRPGRPAWFLIGYPFFFFSFKSITRFLFFFTTVWTAEDN